MKHFVYLHQNTYLMKEIIFIRKNIEKWRVAQKVSRNIDKNDPGTIAEIYQDISADLAFAQTHYPGSELIPYLNSISLTLHNAIYAHKQQRVSTMIRFWTHEIPYEMYRNRNMMMLSLVIFFISTVIGIVSTVGEPDFAVQIMGPQYIEMTLENIKNGNPMAVYGWQDSYEMMLSITLNNIGVSLVAYAAGILTSFVSGIILVMNGVMLGTFLTFCYQHGVLYDCLMAVWMHGVIEISSIVIAGGAGLTLGKGWLFPGTLPRITSFKLYAKSSAKIALGLIPMFVIAGFIESFVTRHTDAPFLFRILVIGLSAVFIFFYFVYLPIKRKSWKEQN